MRNKTLCAAALFTTWGLAPWASAATVTVNFTTPYTDPIYPQGEGGPIYMTATFEDVSSGVVKLTLDTNGLKAPNEFVSKWYFNLDPLLDVTKLAFSLDAPATTGPESAYAFVKQANSLDLGGQAVGFDFGPEFSTSSRGGGAERFNADELFVGTITTTQAPGAGIPVLSAASFQYLNAGDGNNDVFFYGIAHVQGIDPGNQSTKLGGGLGPNAVPLPAPVMAGLALLGATAGVRKLRRRQIATP